MMQCNHHHTSNRQDRVRSSADIHSHLQPYNATLRPGQITTEQLLNFFNLNGISLKPMKDGCAAATMGLLFEERLINAAKDLNNGSGP
jgi:hypothetical protein